MLVSINMKDERSETPQKRPYRMRARAEAAAETGRRILEAVIELHRERFWDQVSLRRYELGVTVQTVIRRFGTKERLIEAAAEEGTRQVVRQRDQAPVGDIEGAVENLVDHYEWAAVAGHRGSGLRRSARRRRGSRFHYEWVERTFALCSPSAAVRRADVFWPNWSPSATCTWKLLRRDLGLSREQTELAITETILALEGES